MQTQEEIQLELALVEPLRKQCEHWVAENPEAVRAYNEEVEVHGVFSDDVRSF